MKPPLNPDIFFGAYDFPFCPFAASDIAVALSGLPILTRAQALDRFYNVNRWDFSGTITSTYTDNIDPLNNESVNASVTGLYFIVSFDGGTTANPTWRNWQRPLSFSPFGICGTWNLLHLKGSASSDVLWGITSDYFKVYRQSDSEWYMGFNPYFTIPSVQSVNAIIGDRLTTSEYASSATLTMDDVVYPLYFYHSAHNPPDYVVSLSGNIIATPTRVADAVDFSGA